MSKAFMWTSDEHGCGYYRGALPAAALRSLGHDVQHGMQFPEAYQDAEAVMGQRLVNPASAQNWAVMNNAGVRLVYDIDDDLFEIDPTNEAAYQQFMRSMVMTRVCAVAHVADVVTCASPRLAEIMTNWAQDVRVVPNGLPAEVLAYESPVVKHAHAGLTRTRLGWVGSGSTMHELPIIGALVADMLRKDYSLSIKTIGLPGDLIKAKAGWSGARTNWRSWIAPGPEYLKSCNFDVWLAPYRATPFNEAKGATKALEAAFLGIPIVASSIRPYREFIEHGVTGFLCSTPEDWRDAIEALRYPGRRLEMGAAARAQVLQRGLTAEAIAASAWGPALFGDAA